MSLLGALSVGIFVLGAVVLNGIHQVPEGYVGVSWRGGKLLETVMGPGLHLKIPLIDSVESMQITMQTDSVTDIPCGTSGGVVISFGRIEVVNKLKAAKVLDTVRNYGVHYDKIWIFDKIHHEINQFCSSHSLKEVFIEKFDTLDESLAKALQADCDKYDTGIDIITVRVTKPRIPESVRKNYELIEAERTTLALTVERQAVVERQAKTQAEKARIEAENAKAIRQIEMQKEILEREAEQKKRKIDDEILVSNEKAKADANLYKAQKEAEANKLRMTPEFLQYTLYTSVANNSKIFFGESIPKMFSWFNNGEEALSVGGKKP